MSIDWLPNALTATVGIAGMIATYRTGKKQRDTQLQLAREQDIRHEDQEVAQAKRELYGKLIGRLKRASFYIQMHKTHDRRINETKDEIIRDAIEKVLTENEVELPSDTLTTMTEQARVNIDAKFAENVEKSRIKFLQGLGFSSYSFETQVAVDEIFALAAEVSFLSEQAFEDKINAATSGLVIYLIMEDNPSVAQANLEAAISNLQIAMQVDITKVRS